MAKVMNLSLREKSDLVHVAYDDLIHPEMANYPRYLAAVRRMKHIALANTFNFGIMTIATGTFANSELERLHDLGFKYACLWTDGSYPLEHDFENDLLRYCQELDKGDKPWLCMGHILNRRNSNDYPHFHEQPIVMNLETWYSMKDEDGWINLFHEYPPEVTYLPPFRVSEENIHDDYTPLWIEKSIIDERDRDNTTLQFREGAFNRLMIDAIKRNFRIYNFPPELRKMKGCYYLEDDIEETIKWLFSEDYYMTTDERYAELKHDLKQNGMEDKLDLWSLKRQTENILYITNTEGVPNFDKLLDFKAVDINTYIVPCSGFNQFEFMLEHIDSLQNVVFYDANRNSIAWMKHLVNDWDGVSDLFAFIQDYIDQLPSAVNVIYNKRQVEEFLEATTEEQRIRLFTLLREDHVQYIHLDIMRDWHKLVDATPDNTNVLINLTNIWRYEGNFINNRIFDCELAFYNLLGALEAKSNELLFKGDDPHGKYFDCRSITKSKGFI